MRERKRNRLINFDYSSDNLYFVTSVIKDRICYFGNVVDEKMQLNQYGEIAQQQWEWLLNQYPYIKSHAFVVMPNHIHAILEINREYIGTGREYVGTGRDLSLRIRVSPRNPNQSIKIKPLSQLMGAYKTTTSKKIHLAGNNDFAWQRSFHDRIIRDKSSCEKIITYIQNNPMNWNSDSINNDLKKPVK